MTSLRRKKYIAIDLFCGCGGLSLGLGRAGFNVVAAIDNDSLSISSYRMNHRKTYTLREDIRSIDPRALMDKLSLTAGELDLMAGCPPCQGYSTLRTLNGRYRIDDPMNDLIFEFVRFAEAFMPKTIMLENVPTLLIDPRLTILERKLESIGYRCEANIFNAEKYGVAQRRLRMILLGSRENCPPFAQPVRKTRTVAEAFRNLESPETSEDPLHNYSVSRAKHVKSLIRRIPKDGGSRTDLPEDEQLQCHRKSNGFKDVYGRMSWRKPAPTITGGCINPSKGRYIHPEDDRAITLREAALLQGFPYTYSFDMSRGRYSVAQMIGNAFPPKFAEHHAREIYRFLETRSILAEAKT